MTVDNHSTHELKKEIEQLKKEKGAVIMAHYYQPADIQDIADYVGDSLALAQIAAKLENDIIVVCGVHFMAETAKILCPGKKVLIPEPKAGCSLAQSCPADKLKEFIEAHPGHTVISYVNTSADVKALTDIVVTSGNARKIVESLPQDEKIIFGPDKNLGEYINRITGREMVLWDGACLVHEKFSIDKIKKLKEENSDAPVLIHPECKKELQLMADKVGSTAVLLKYACESDAKRFIVVTESGILHEMQKRCPDKEFIPGPADDTCGCNECADMKLNTLTKLRDCLRDESNQVEVDAEIAAKAVRPIERMLELSK